jgi:hypothetical protein
MMNAITSAGRASRKADLGESIGEQLRPTLHLRVTQVEIGRFGFGRLVEMDVEHQRADAVRELVGTPEHWLLIRSSIVQVEARRHRIVGGGVRNLVEAAPAQLLGAVAHRLAESLRDERDIDGRHESTAIDVRGLASRRRGSHLHRAPAHVDLDLGEPDPGAETRGRRREIRARHQTVVIEIRV